MGFKPRGLGSLKAQLAKLTPKLFASDKAFAEKNGCPTDETFEGALGAPCSTEEIDALEAELGKTLPPTYRAFLSLYSHWLGVPGCGGADLLGPKEHRDPHVRKTLGWKSDFFTEFEGADNNPLAKGAIPLAVGDDRNMILLEEPRRADGELQIVHYYLTEEEHRYGDLIEMFKALIRDD